MAQQTAGEQLAAEYAALGDMGLETQQEATRKRLASIGLNEKGKAVKAADRQHGAVDPDQQVKPEPAGEGSDDTPAERRAAAQQDRSEPPAGRQSAEERRHRA